MTIHVASGLSLSSATYHGVQAMNYGKLPDGSIGVTNGSPNVVGTGTHFTTQLEASYQLALSSGNAYIVTSITDDTHLTLTTNVTDTTGSYNGTPNFLVPNDAFTRVPLRGPNVWDTDNFHFTDHTALSGTVTKSSSSTIITGSGTSFTSQLNVNQIVDIPGGGGTDTVVVKSITDNTHFVAWQMPVHSASGQTATKNPDCIAIPPGITNGVLGNFVAYLYQDWAYSNTGQREIDLMVNVSTGATITQYNQIQGEFLPPVTLSGDETAAMCTLPFQATDGDQISCYVYQNSGGSLAMTPDYPAGTAGGNGGYSYGMGIQFLGVPA